MIPFQEPLASAVPVPKSGSDITVYLDVGLLLPNATQTNVMRNEREVVGITESMDDFETYPADLVDLADLLPHFKRHKRRPLLDVDALHFSG